MDRVLIFAICLGAFAATIPIVLVAVGFPLVLVGDTWPLIGFMALALLVERQSIPLTPTAQVSVAFLPLIFVGVVFGPLAAVAVGAASMVAEFPKFRRDVDPAARPYLRWFVWTSTRSVVAAVGGLAAYAAMSDGSPDRVIIATAAATIVGLSVDLALTALTLRVRETGRARDLVRAAAPVVAAGIPIYGAASALLAYAYLHVTPWSAALFFLPALAAQRLFVSSREQQLALRELADAYAKLEKANLSFAAALVATLDARDRYTAGHSASVARYAHGIAKELGLSADTQQLTHLCGLVHDIGKVGLPPGVLEKPGRLTDEERAIMEEHSAIGERILANVDGYADIAKIVRHHHERIDGLGYPDRLTHFQIPLISRLLAVADAYDAMTSDRPYRAALPKSEAVARLIEGSGSQFDPPAVDALVTFLYTAGELEASVSECLASRQDRSGARLVLA